MSDRFVRFFHWIRRRKKEFFFALLCFLLFSVLLFPFDDLSDLVTEQVAKHTQDQVFLRFENLSLSLIPPGLGMSSVVMDSTFLPQIKAKTLALSPSIAGLLTFKPGFVARADGLFGGDLNFSLKAGDEVGDGIRSQNVSLNAYGMDIRELSKMANTPVEIFGKGDFQIRGELDPSFAKQPDTEYQLTLHSFRVPAGSIPTMVGPLNLPTIDLSGMNVKGRLVGGEFIIEESAIGKAGDFISGRIKGKLGLRLDRQSGQVQPRFGAYELKIDLSLNRDAESQIGVFLSLFDKYKTLTGTGARYTMQLSGPDFQSFPKDQALTAF